MYNPFAFKKNNAKINELRAQAEDTCNDDETRAVAEKNAKKLVNKRSWTIAGIAGVGVSAVVGAIYYVEQNEPEIAEDILPEME